MKKETVLLIAILVAILVGCLVGVGLLLSNGDTEGDPTTMPTTSQDPPCYNPSWLSNACAARDDPESE